ncbi:MAG: protein-S-isoprenylcysteine O-methyltransferase [Pseudomonadota bacterium]
MIGHAVPYLIMLIAGGIALWRDAPYATLPILIMMVLWYSVRVYHVGGQSNSVKFEKDGGRERPLASLVGVGMTVLPVLALVLPPADLLAYSGFPGQLTSGVIIGLVGTYVFWCAHRDLGQNWSAHLEIREEHKLITAGIYGRVRHPMYSAIFLLTLSQTFMLTNWVAGPAGLVFFSLLYATRIRPEEAMMQDQFGQQWVDYASKTPRLIPKMTAN